MNEYSMRSPANNKPVPCGSELSQDATSTGTGGTAPIPAMEIPLSTKDPLFRVVSRIYIYAEESLKIDWYGHILPAAGSVLNGDRSRIPRLIKLLKEAGGRIAGNFIKEILSCSGAAESGTKAQAEDSQTAVVIPAVEKQLQNNDLTPDLEICCQVRVSQGGNPTPAIDVQVKHNER